MAVTGLRSLQHKLTKKIPDRVRSAVKQSLAQSADELVDTMKGLAPVGPPSGQQAAKGAKPGALRDSIVATFGGDAPKYAAFRSRRQKKGRHSTIIQDKDPDMSVTITAGNSQVRYAHLVEFGTAPHKVGGMFEGAMHPGTAPQPFFYPAYRLNKRKIKSRINRAIKRALQEGAK